MVRKFRANNAIKGRVAWQMQMFVNSGAISFEKGEKRNTCFIIVNESQIESRELDYLYSNLIPNHKSREVMQ